MQRIATLLQKISELSNENATVIEIDLMMDYTKVIYADLLEWRNRVAFNSSLQQDTGRSTFVADQPSITDEIKETPVPPATEEPTSEPEKIIVQVANPPDEETVYSPKEQPAIDIRTFIGINDKYQFISELFGNNKDAYNEVLDELNLIETYNEAVHWLKMSVADQYSWDEDSPAVQSFHGILSQFFSSM